MSASLVPSGETENACVPGRLVIGDDRPAAFRHLVDLSLVRALLGRDEERLFRRARERQSRPLVGRPHGLEVARGDRDRFAAVDPDRPEVVAPAPIGDEEDRFAVAAERRGPERRRRRRASVGRVMGVEDLAPRAALGIEEIDVAVLGVFRVLVDEERLSVRRPLDARDAPVVDLGKIQEVEPSFALRGRGRPCARRRSSPGGPAAPQARSFPLRGSRERASSAPAPGSRTRGRGPIRPSTSDTRRCRRRETSTDPKR